jgi:hypothetical protein
MGALNDLILTMKERSGAERYMREGRAGSVEKAE